MTRAIETSVVLTAEVKKKADQIVANYEKRRAALLPVLHLIQNTYGVISKAAEVEIADYIGIPAVDVKEVITFYTLYKTRSCAKNELNVCRTLSCWLGGGEEITKYIKTKLGIEAGAQTADGKFSLNLVECLGACELAPMMQVGREYIGPLTKEKVDQLIEKLK